MSDFDDLRAHISPPGSPLCGDLGLARTAVEAYVEYPKEYWEVLGTYGAGYFYGTVGLMHPCEPAFVLRFAMLVNELKAALASSPHLFVGRRWLPVAEYGEWCLFVESGAGAHATAIFACLGDTDVYRSIDVGVAAFLRHFPTPEMQRSMFGSEGHPQELNFLVSEFQLELAQAELHAELKKNRDLEFLRSLASELQPCWTLGLPFD